MCRRRVPVSSSASLTKTQPSIASSSSATVADVVTAGGETVAGSKPLGLVAEGRESVPTRALGCSERFFHLYSLAFPVHFCLVAEIDGALDSARLAAALDQVRRRHSALRVCIVDDTETGPAFHRVDNPIELHTAPVAAALAWRAVVEMELNVPFDAARGPLMRAMALWAPDGASIVLTFHHAAMDALSATRVLHDVLRALAGESLGVLPPCPPVEEMIAGFAPGLTFVGKDVSRAETSSKAGAQAAPVPDRFMANLATMKWDKEETARLLRSCKANGTTVHGAICAAASRHLPASDANVIRLHCPVDLGRIMRSEATGCGVFITAGIVEIATSERRSLWQDARDIVDRLRTARSPAAVAGMLQWIAAEIAPTAGKESVAALFASLPQSSAVISNLGVLPLAVEYGTLKLKAVWGPALLTNLPADRQTIGVSTFAGQLRMVHQSYEPISGLLEAIRETLLTACG
ncbi:condensation domain-containing protein [Bradyrhizobium sp. UFLA05-112]